MKRAWARKKYGPNWWQDGNNISRLHEARLALTAQNDKEKTLKAEAENLFGDDNDKDEQDFWAKMGLLVYKRSLGFYEPIPEPQDFPEIEDSEDEDDLCSIYASKPEPELHRHKTYPPNFDE